MARLRSEKPRPRASELAPRLAARTSPARMRSRAARDLLRRYRELERRAQPTVAQVHVLATLVLELGYHDLRGKPGFEHGTAVEKVADRYRRHLAGQPKDARSLNNLAALLLSFGHVNEGRRYARLALAVEPSERTIHENVAIADVYCGAAARHGVPNGLAATPGYLRAYFDPHAH